MPNPSRDPGPGPSPAGQRPLSFMAKAATALCGLYAAVVLGVWAFLAFAPATDWVATLLLYGPRWAYATPLVLLVPLTAFRPRLLLPLGAVTPVLLGPLMGGCLPWRAWASGGDAGGTPFKVMSLNMQGDASDAFAIGRLIVDEAPDLVVFVESSSTIRADALWRGRWYVERVAGITMASRHRILRADTLKHPSVRPGAILRCDLDVRGRTMTAFGIHLSTPRGGLEMATHLSPDTPAAIRESVGLQVLESQEVGAWVAGRGDAPTLAMGDFNMPQDAAIYRKEFGGFANAFAEAGFGFGPTKFTRYFGARIDHILHDGHWRATRCWVGPDVGSDHRPVLAELRWVDGPSPEPQAADGGDRRDP